MKKLLLVVLVLGVGLFVGCGGSSSSSGGGGGNPVTLVAIQVTPATPSIAKGATQAFKATGSYSDGTTKDLTSTANWLSSNTSVATINISGLATGVGSGTSTITASSGGVTGTTTLTVTNPPLVSIAISPTSSTLSVGGQQAFTATGTYGDGSTQNITTSVTWQSSNPNVAAINPSGLAVAQAPGTTLITASSQGITSNNASLTVSNPLVSIAVTAPSLSIAPNTSVQFTATGTYADSTTAVITSSVTWASSNTSVATISNSQGTQGLASALAAGTTSITATSGSITSPPVTLTVKSVTLVSIAVTPANAQLVYQSPQQYTATGTYSDSSTQDITNSVTWASGDKTKIVIVASGLATGVATTGNPVTISATQGAVTGSTTATVIPPPVTSIAITPNITTMAQGTSVQYTATATLSNGSTLNVSSQATWTSSNPSIATVGLHSGLVKAAASVSSSTTVVITASYGGVSQTLQLLVTNATVNTITVSPIAPTIPAFVSQKFVATATFSDGTQQDVSRDATWTSDNTAVATVNTVGVASALTPGIANITASFGAHSGVAQLTVSFATLTSIVISPTSATLAPGSTVNFSAVGHFSDSSTQIITPTWNSSNTSVVTVNANGVATAQQAGTATITATYQGVTSNSASIVVSQFPLVSIAVTPASVSVPVAVGTQFVAIGTFSDSSTQNLTNSVTWASSPSSVATISNTSGRQGFATGVTAGQAAITAVFAPIVSPAATLTVTTAPLLSIAVTPSNPMVVHGTALQFTANGTFGGISQPINLTTQVTWTSSDATVATISGSGLASTVAAGTTTITATFVQNGVTVQGTATLTVN